MGNGHLVDGQLFLEVNFSHLKKRSIIMKEKGDKMKLFLKKQTDTYLEAKARKVCCDRMTMALRNHDVIFTYDNNKNGFGCIKKWNTDDQILCTIGYCPWCGEKIEMEAK